MRLGRKGPDRGTSPPGKSFRTGAAYQGVPVSYEPLPGRRKDGWALDYWGYKPSMYYVAEGKRTKKWEGRAEERVREMIAELRGILNGLDGIDEMRDEEAGFERRLRGVEARMERVRACIEEVGGGAGGVVLVRKVSGRPRRGLSGRSFSMGKRRRWGAAEEGEILGRKPSGRLRRLGSAGGMLIRRLSRVSGSEDRGMGVGNGYERRGQSVEVDPGRGRENVAEVLKGYEEEMKGLEQEAVETERKLGEVKERIDAWRELHVRAVEILDDFYGSLPGWEDNAVARRMLPEVAEMTEAGLEAERDLVQTRRERERVRAAKEDYERSLNALRRVGECLAQVAESGEERLLRRALMLVGIARECSGVTRVEQLEREIDGLELGDMGAVSCECKLAEAFVAERLRLITEDLEVCERRVERSERDVVAERVAILDLFHPEL